jgi:hypothetical protein
MYIPIASIRPDVLALGLNYHDSGQRKKCGDLIMSVLNEVLEANREYVSKFGDRGTLSLPPARRFAILTCMDARLDPAGYAGLSEGDAHVIRNAGGRATTPSARW